MNDIACCIIAVCVVFCCGFQDDRDAVMNLAHAGIPGNLPEYQVHRNSILIPIGKGGEGTQSGRWIGIITVGSRIFLAIDGVIERDDHL